MKNLILPTPAEFDEHARDYDQKLNQGLAASGESKEYFAFHRIKWVADSLKRHGLRCPRRILDFGCGDGGSFSFLAREFCPEYLVGADISAESLKAAAERVSTIANVQFHLLYKPLTPAMRFDLAFCNGVFHHIPVGERAASLAYLYEALSPGGIFAFWENNPWNPGTRYIMSRIPFDRDAIPLSVLEARRLLRHAGFRLISTSFLFIFPRSLRALRFIERRVSRLPLGGQYLALCRKPDGREERPVGSGTAGA